MINKALIFDSGTLINLSMNGLLYIIEELKKNFDGKFLITNQVKREIVDRPISIQRFELGALRIQSLINSEVLELHTSLGIKEEEITKETKILMDAANHSVRKKNKWINIVSDAEISCLALSSILTKMGIKSIIAIDERTTRTLVEKPQNLEKIMNRKLHGKVEIVKSHFNYFKNFKFLRSTELVFVANKKGLIKIKGKKVLEATLYATKFKGASVSFEEINELKKL